MKFLSKAYMFIIFALLYAPIVVLVIFSFNESGSLAEFTSPTLEWYEELFADEAAFTALKNSLILAVSSALLSTVIGTFAALGLYHMRKRYVKNAIKSVTNIPMVNPSTGRVSPQALQSASYLLSYTCPVAATSSPT